MVSAEDLPILGESLGIELANTLYGSGEDAFDFLAERPNAELWCAQLAAEHRFLPPVRFGTLSDLERLRRLRDAAHRVLVALSEGSMPTQSAISALNLEAAAGSAHVELVWSANSKPSARVIFRGPRLTRLLSRLATSCIDLCVDVRESAVRRCEGPGCTLLFVQHDRRRRFCHESCSHRARQRKYWRSTQ